MLKDGGATTQLAQASSTIGYLPRGGELQTGAIVATIPTVLEGAERSVCGLKAFLVDERRRFEVAGDIVEIDCAKVAALDISDSPIHVHGETTETYQILHGEGRMVLGNELVPVSAGTFILIPPGVQHGMAAASPEHPVRVLMTFTPGLAPIQHQHLRDEKILHASSREWMHSKYRPNGY